MSERIDVGDPPVPGGFLWAVAIGALFAVGVWLWHGIAEPRGTLDRYLADRAAALDTGALLSEEMLVDMAGDPLAVEAGKRAFAANCATCHGPRAEGDEGPRLAGNEFIAESDAIEVYSTIVEGRNEKGMPPWGSLGPGACMQLTAYLLTLNGAADSPGTAGEDEPPGPAR